MTFKLTEFMKNPIKFFLWIFIGILMGISGGILGSLFHLCVDRVTEFRNINPWILLLLPVGGVIITFFYRLFKKQGALNTDRILHSVRNGGDIPFVTVPLIFGGAAISHLLGASVGREGAALQLGGGLGYSFGKLLRFNRKNLSVIVMAGMSGVFSALFGTPVTAAFFAIEVITAGSLQYNALISCTISSLCAFKTASLFGISPVKFNVTLPVGIQLPTLVQVAALAALCALVSILFCKALNLSERYAEKFFQNPYIRGIVGGIIIILLTVIIGSTDYNGAGMDVISRAMSGEARPEAFILKIIFTAISVSAGFKGGEIVPVFFAGSAFGCFAGGLIGLDPGFGAAVGMICVFCGVVNCPIASFMLAMEVFGGGSPVLFALAVVISFVLSGKCSLYKDQFPVR